MVTGGTLAAPVNREPKVSVHSSCDMSQEKSDSPFKNTRSKVGQTFQHQS